MYGLPYDRNEFPDVLELRQATWVFEITPPPILNIRGAPDQSKQRALLILRARRVTLPEKNIQTATDRWPFGLERVYPVGPEYTHTMAAQYRMSADDQEVYELLLQWFNAVYDIDHRLFYGHWKKDIVAEWARVYILDPSGQNIIKSWIFINLWPQRIDAIELSTEAELVGTLGVTWAFDYYYRENLPEPVLLQQRE